MAPCARMACMCSLGGEKHVVVHIRVVPKSPDRLAFRCDVSTHLQGKLLGQGNSRIVRYFAELLSAMHPHGEHLEEVATLLCPISRLNDLTNKHPSGRRASSLLGQFFFRGASFLASMAVDIRPTLVLEHIETEAVREGRRLDRAVESRSAWLPLTFVDGLVFGDRQMAHAYDTFGVEEYRIVTFRWVAPCSFRIAPPEQNCVPRHPTSTSLSYHYGVRQGLPNVCYTLPVQKKARVVQSKYGRSPARWLETRTTNEHGGAGEPRRSPRRKKEERQRTFERQQTHGRSNCPATTGLKLPEEGSDKIQHNIEE